DCLRHIALWDHGHRQPTPLPSSSLRTASRVGVSGVRDTCALLSRGGFLRRRVELYEQPLGPAKDDRFVVVEVILVCGKAEVVHAGEDALERDCGLHAAQRRAHTEVWAVAERHVGFNVLALDVKRLRVWERALVAVGRAPDDEHDRTGGDRDAVDLGVLYN